MTFRHLAPSGLAVALAAGVSLAHARVARIVVDKVDRPADCSGYEVLRGRAFGTLDPAAPGCGHQP
jgi:hypothetical protein